MLQSFWLKTLIRQEINMARDNIDVVATTSAAVGSAVVSLLPGALSSSYVAAW